MFNKTEIINQNLTLKRVRVNVCCRGEAISRTVWVRLSNVSYPASTAHDACYIIWGLSDTIIFFHIMPKTARFSEKILNIKYVFWLSLRISSETFVILRRIQRDNNINVRRSLWTIPVTLAGTSWNFNFLDRFSKFTFSRNSSGGSQVVPRVRTDKTDR
jgi:hypothetical protein